MNILHLSDTTLSGSPIRICQLLNKYTKHEARHITWKPTVFGWRKFDLDMVGSDMTKEDIGYWIYEWADIIHYHNRWKRQEIFQSWGFELPVQPGVIQMHSPRDSEDFREEVFSKVPIAVVAQYQVRQWPELRFIVPNVVDVNDGYHKRNKLHDRHVPVVSYAPTNCNNRGWNDKGYWLAGPFLKRLKYKGTITYQLLYQKPHKEVLELKELADIGIDDIITGSYHLSSLEYLSMDIPCFNYIDEKTERVVKDLTGAKTLPWMQVNKSSFKSELMKFIQSKEWRDKQGCRKWMKKYWSPKFLCKKYTDMYKEL